jgi:O-acetyl-ADP-ribose deacetylase (regulator of RNase III)
METYIQNRRLSLCKGDITAAVADSIVNAANAQLAGGGGVDGAIHRVGGPDIMAECRKIGACATGDAVATGAGRLTANHVIHAVAPVWRGGLAREPESLRRAYRRSLEVAARLGDRTIALPSLGTGAYGYPVAEAAAVALGTVAEFLRLDARIVSATFFLYSDEVLAVYCHALSELLHRREDGNAPVST